MPLITDITATWSAPTTLTSAEVWQARSRVFVSPEASPGTNDGIEMQPGDAIRFETAEAVRYRSPEAGAQIYRTSVK